MDGTVSESDAGASPRGSCKSLDVYGPSRNKGIKRIWVEIRTVWPVNSSQLRVHSNLAKLDWIPEWGKDSLEVGQFGDVNYSFDAIIERNAKLVPFQGFDFRNLMHILHSKGAMGSNGCRALARCQSSMSSKR